MWRQRPGSSGQWKTVQDANSSKSSESILKGRTPDELRSMFKDMGLPEYRGAQAFKRINRHLARTADDITEFPKDLRTRLAELEAMPVIDRVESSRDTDGTEKFVFQCGIDRRDSEPKRVEAVWIVSDTRRTACISSQAGCTLNCAFCATGTLKFRGNLPAWQILEQAYELIRVRGEALSNVVFMGMGEPFYNYDNVIRAARILNHPEGLHLSARHITISTAGVIPGIERFIEERQPFNLAISLNHPDAGERASIMDVDERFPLNDLLKVVRRYGQETRRPVTFEYVMIPDVNMGAANAAKLIKIARSMKCKINLIPLNTTLHGWRRPLPEEADAFQMQLVRAGVRAFNRGSPGRQVGGACGMLALSGAG
ncbi:MAG: radical SAM protein [Spirochaetia bacterium]|nr:radical SAM protein [Spirochaetia bacterium]